MKTTFILYGGFNPAQPNDGNAAFSEEILKHAPENARVLLVPFAKEADRILPTTERVTNELNAKKWQNNIVIDVATLENFAQQIADADVVYFQGGSSSRLLEALIQFPNLKELIKGKIIAGDSAGANVLSAFFYSSSADSIKEGLGIVPVKIIPHYKDDYAGKLDGVGSELESLLLLEYTYKVITID